MPNIPQIDNGKTLSQLCICLPSDTPYGNLLLKGMNIVRRIDRVNMEIVRVFESYVHPNNADIDNPEQDLLEQQFYEEQVIYWMRKTADELISLAYVIDEWTRTETWPAVIKIDSIDGLLNGNTSKRLQQLFELHNESLKTLNEIANAFKHSFINTDISVMGSEYPVVYALALKRNNLAKNPQFYSVNFAEMIHAYSNFYKQSVDTISNWTNKNKK